MSTLVLERTEEAQAAGRITAGAPGALLTGSRGGPTLDELITGVWEGLSAQRPVSCPACGGAMGPRYFAGGSHVAGECGDCGSTLT